MPHRTNALRRIAAGIALGGVSALMALAVHRAGWLERLELVTWDLRQRWFAAPAPPDVPIKLVLIDQPSLEWAREQAGTPWPWPREFYSAIIEFCRAGGAKSIAFDLFFSEPSVFGQDDDDRFAEALRNGGATILAVPPGPTLSTPAAWPDGIPPSRFTVTGLEQWTARHPQADLTLNSVVMSMPEIAGSASALGHVRGDQDVDSIFRRVSPIVTFGGQVLPVLGLAAHEIAAGDAASPIPALRIDGDSLFVGSHRIPLDEQGMAILRFRAPTVRGLHTRMYEAFSAAGVINSQLAIAQKKEPALSPEVFRDCHVFIGANAPGTYDLKPTPMNKAGPGVEVNATFLDNLLNDEFMRSGSELTTWLLTIGFSMLGAFMAIACRNALHAVLAFAILLPCPWLAGMLAFKQGWWWPIVIPEFGLGLALVNGMIANYATEGRQRRFIKRSFQHYLSPVVIDQIVQDPSRLRLGGDRREVTVFFSDLAGFSGTAENMDPQALAALLNEYLSDMTSIILDEAGTVDKYIGDAIVAFWNAPLEQADHALRAARAAIRCQHRLAERREDYRRMFGSDLHMRIGVNTGTVSVGNFGSRDRFDYTIIGHAVNVASRLEGVNKVFGTGTLIADDTWRQTAGGLRGREVGLIRVVGVVEPIRVHEPLPEAAQAAEHSVRAYQAALELCQQGKCAEALAAFERLDDDPLARRYSEKLRTIIRDGSGQWDGVWNLTEK